MVDREKELLMQNSKEELAVMLIEERKRRHVNQSDINQMFVFLSNQFQQLEDSIGFLNQMIKEE